MLSLSLRSATDALPLDGLVSGEAGVQATSGALGFGLPPLAHQWVEGAGHGATHRGYRALSRTIDLPLTIEAPTRQGLRAVLRRLSLILAGPATLRAHDSTDGTMWDLSVVRSGGGDYTYGTDTTGDTSLDMVVTLTAGDPFWTRVDQSSFLVETPNPGAGLLPNLTRMTLAGSQAFGTRTVENPGDVETYPVWKIEGPGKNFEAKSAKGEVLRWTGTLAANEVLHIDSGKGTVVDGKGVNRYAELAAAPRFWPIAPGESEVSVKIDDSSPGTMTPVRDTRVNLTPNPLPAPTYGSAPTNWRSAAVDNNLMVIEDEGETAIMVTKAGAVSYYIDPNGPATNGRWPLKVGEAWRMVTDVKVLKPQRMRLVGATYGPGGVGGVRIFDQYLDMTPEDGWRTMEASGYVTDETAVDGRFLVWPAFMKPRNIAANAKMDTMTGLTSTGSGMVFAASGEGFVRGRVVGSTTKRGGLVQTRIPINAAAGTWIGVAVDVRSVAGTRDIALTSTYLAGGMNTSTRWTNQVDPATGEWTRLVASFQVPLNVESLEVGVNVTGGFNFDPYEEFSLASDTTFDMNNFSVHQATSQANAIKGVSEWVDVEEGAAYLVRRTLIQKGDVVENLTGDFFHGGSTPTGSQIYRTVPNSNGTLPTSVESEAELRGITRISCAWRPRAWTVI